MGKKYTCAGMNCGGRVKGYASGGSVVDGDDVVPRPKYTTPPSERGAVARTSPLGGRLGERAPRYSVEDDVTASKRR